MQRITLLLLTILGLSSVRAQLVHPANNHAFLQDEVASVYITMDSDSLNLLLSTDSLEANYEYFASFTYESSALTQTIPGVGFRLRGNTSRFSEKKSFKVSFNSFVQGQKWQGLEKLNLNGEHNDVSILRSQLSNMCLRAAGLPAARTSYVKLFINGTYKGLYLNVEHLDEEFIQRRFTDDDHGNLYKASYGANLTYLGSNAANYTSKYELKTNKDSNDYSGLIAFTQILNNTSPANFPCAIEEVFDVDLYLRTLAVEILIGHWDGYAFNNNNYYLYQRPSDGKFIFIEYDMDNTFGIDWFGENWATRNIYQWSMQNENRPLYTKILAVPYYRDLFTNYMDSYLNTFFSAGNLVPQLDSIQTLITPAALLDDYKGYDYGFSDQDFLNAIDQAWGNHVTTSIAAYLTNRANSASNQTMIQGAQNPCSLGIDEAHFYVIGPPVKAFNLLGQSIDVNTFNQLIILEDAAGNRWKTWQNNE